MRKLLIILLFLCLFLTGCFDPERNENMGQKLVDMQQTVDDAETFDEDFDMFEEELNEQTVEISDPLEGLNRITFAFNDVLYAWILTPVSQVYADVMPEPVRIGVCNFFNNVTTPIRYANCLLQGKGDGAKAELDRFLINTMEGILGFGDPAKDKHGIEPAKEDLGQTLAKAGLENGFYLVLPLLGPSTLRDAAGKVGDLFLNPIFYLEPWELRMGVSGGKYINESSFHIGEYDSLKADAIDSYILIRQAYIQYRNKQIED